MADINKQIEDNKHWRTFIKENRCWTPTAETIGKLAYNNGYNKTKKEFAHSSRWRKVSEELPPIDTRILVVDGFGCIRFGKLCELDSGKQYWIIEHSPSYEVIEWKPID